MRLCNYAWHVANGRTRCLSVANHGEQRFPVDEFDRLSFNETSGVRSEVADGDDFHGVRAVMREQSVHLTDYLHVHPLAAPLFALDQRQLAVLPQPQVDATVGATKTGFLDRDDTRRAEGSGNVFVDLGFDPAEAEVMRLRAEVMIRIEQLVKAKGWTQVEAARQLGVTQPRVSRLLKGKWEDFSLDMLLTLAARAGLKPSLRLAA